jgi:CubicO group peptidase (beta-lactamase class C family)
VRILLVVSLGCLVACAPLQRVEPRPEPPGHLPTPTNSVVPALDTVLRESGIVTAGFGVVRDGELAWSRYYGEQAPGVEAGDETRFNVASITKLVAAEAALRLVAAGDLDLDAPLSPYWVDPDVAGDPRHRQLTARMVLTHSTGLPNWRFFRQDGKLAFEHAPGSHYGYSGEGFEWLARALEKKLDEPFPAIVRRKVFDPIGMDQAAIAVDRQQLGHMVRAVDAKGTFHGAYCRPEGWCKDDGDYSAADDLIVSIPEFARFLGAVHAADGYGEALATERNRVQTTRGKDQLIDCPANVGVPCPIEQGYGLGFEVARFPDYTMIGHGGSDWAEATLAYVYQPSGDGLIIFLNAPTRQGMAAMADLIAILDPDSPYLPRYRAWQARAVSAAPPTKP